MVVQIVLTQVEERGRESPEPCGGGTFVSFRSLVECDRIAVKPGGCGTIVVGAWTEPTELPGARI